MIKNKLSGKFTKVATTKNSIVIGLLDPINSSNLSHDDIVEIAKFYNINTEPGRFAYHYITASATIKKGCKLPVNNYNDFIQIFV